MKRKIEIRISCFVLKGYSRCFVLSGGISLLGFRKSAGLDYEKNLFFSIVFKQCEGVFCFQIK